MSEPIRHPEDPGEPGVGAPRIAIDPWEGRVLAELARGKRVIEIGTGLGESTRALARSAFEVLTVDIDPWVARTIVPGLPPTVTFVPAVPAVTPEPFDLAFIDGCHRGDAVQADVRAVMPLMKPDGLLVFHDWPAVAEAVGALGVQGVHLQSVYGLGIAFVEEIRSDGQASSPPVVE